MDSVKNYVDIFIDANNGSKVTSEWKHIPKSFYINPIRDIIENCIIVISNHGSFAHYKMARIAAKSIKSGMKIMNRCSICDQYRMNDRCRSYNDDGLYEFHYVCLACDEEISSVKISKVVIENIECICAAYNDILVMFDQIHDQNTKPLYKQVIYPWYPGVHKSINRQPKENLEIFLNCDLCQQPNHTLMRSICTNCIADSLVIFLNQHTISYYVLKTRLLVDIVQLIFDIWSEFPIEY